ncbi:MAG: DUF6485 family protein [Patescibacteria group bacterium]|nr:DUF6485 family protein [Patescibacteria group bacterium]
MECRREENLENCNCSYPGCPRKGLCCECVRHHREIGELPGCFFDEKIEKTYDRSIKKYIEARSNNP